MTKLSKSITQQNTFVPFGEKRRNTNKIQSWFSIEIKHSVKKINLFYRLKKVQNTPENIKFIMKQATGEMTSESGKGYIGTREILPPTVKL